MQHYFQGVDSIKPWEILVILLCGCEEAFISGEKNQDALVFWMIGKSLLAPDPFSVVPFLTVILPEPDHSTPDREHRLPLRTQGLRYHVQGGQWLSGAEAVI